MNAQPTRSAYTTELRVLLCGNCGAPIDVSVQGGIVQCRFCSAQQQMVARTQLPAFAPIQRTHVPEDERIRRLRAQDNRPLMPPPGVAHLFGPGGDIPAWKEQEVFAAWQNARKRTATQALDAAEELLFLTQALGNKFVQTKDWAKHRAMLESALEAFFLPRHRSIVACDLALGSCRQGDAQGGETWLTLADPGSDDLFADSMYRMARARVCATKGDFQGVITALGASNADVPIHDALDSNCTVHRANAWERLGRIDVAVRELQIEMAKSPQSRSTVEGIVRLYGLCPQSFPAASGAIQQRSAQSAAAMASGGIDKVFVPLGAVMLVLGAVLGIGAILAGIGVLGNDQILVGLLGLGGGITAATFFFMGIIFFAIGKAMRGQAEKAKYLALNGIRARGSVISIQPTGMSINHVPQMLLRMRVEIDGQAPYDASLKMLVPPHQVAQLAHGAMLSLRVDPRNPQEIAVEA